MFLFKAHRSFSDSFKHHNTNPGEDLGIVHFFEGPVPASMDDIAFDPQDPYDIVTNQAVHTQTLRYSYNDVDADPNLRSTLRGRTEMRFDTRIHTPFPGSDDYYLYPNRIVHTRYQDEFGFPVSATHLDDDNELRGSHWVYRYDNMARFADPAGNKSTNNFGGTVLDGSSPAPMVFVYDQEVTVNAIKYISWTSASNYPSNWYLEYWDSVGEQWVTALAKGTYDNLFLTNQYRTLKLDTPVTSTHFRLSWNGTGGGSFAINLLNLVGPQPTWGTDAKTITWALVYPYVNLYSTYHKRFNTQSYNKKDSGYALYMCNVGEVGSGAPIELSSTTIDSYFGPTISNFNLEFKDNL